ncbi:hypothetical protein CR513_10704, partial [Mucuna pruriens]
MTRSSSDPLYDLDLEIELTLRRLRKARNIVVSDSSNSVSSSDNSSLVTNTFDSVEYSSTNNSIEQMENNNERTMKELATPDVVYQPWCFQYPQLEPAQTYELKSSLIHLRRSPQALERIPFDLLHNETIGDIRRLHQDKGVSILLGWGSKRLVPVLFNTWGDIKRMFLEKFFLASRTLTIKKEICGIREHPGETLHEYWERFNKLCATCLHHQISE